MEKKEMDEIKKRAAIAEEREKRLMAEERRANKAKTRRNEAWQSLAKAKAYRDRVTMAKTQSDTSEKPAEPSKTPPAKPAKRRGTLLDSILGD